MKTQSHVSQYCTQHDCENQFICENQFQFHLKSRNKRSKMSFKIGVLNYYVIPTGKHLSWSLFLIKLQPLNLQLYYKETPTQVFPCEYCKILRAPFFIEHLKWLLLKKHFLLLNVLISISFQSRSVVRNSNKKITFNVQKNKKILQKLLSNKTELPYISEIIWKIFQSATYHME